MADADMIGTVAEALAGVTITDPDFHGLEREDWRELAAAALKTIREHGKAAPEAIAAAVADHLADLFAQVWDEGHRTGLTQADYEYGHRLTLPNLTNPYRQEG